MSLEISQLVLIAVFIPLGGSFFRLVLIAVWIPQRPNFKITKLEKLYRPRIILTCSDWTPTENTRPSGSKAQTGFPWTCINPTHWGLLKSHKRTELSRAPEINVSSAGDISKLITFLVCPVKYLINLLSCRLKYRMASSRFVDAWIAALWAILKTVLEHSLRFWTINWFWMDEINFWTYL